MDFTSKPKTTEVLVALYKFLTKLSYQQPKMQQILKDNLDTFLEHLDDPRFIPAHLTMAELYRNNMELLRDEDKIK